MQHRLKGSDVGTMGAPVAGTPVKIVISRVCPYGMCSFHTTLDHTNLLCKNWCTKLLCRNWWGRDG